MVKLSANNMTIIVRAAVSFPGAVSSVADSVCARARVCVSVCFIHSFMRGQEEEEEDEEKPLLHRCPAATAPHRTAPRALLPCRLPLPCAALPYRGKYWRQEVQVYGTPLPPDAHPFRTTPRLPLKCHASPPPTTRPKMHLMLSLKPLISRMNKRSWRGNVTESTFRTSERAEKDLKWEILFHSIL